MGNDPAYIRPGKLSNAFTTLFKLCTRKSAGKRSGRVLLLCDDSVKDTIELATTSNIEEDCNPTMLTRAEDHVDLRWVGFGVPNPSTNLTFILKFTYIPR
jgi:hypothetical protein